MKGILEYQNKNYLQIIQNTKEQLDEIKKDKPNIDLNSYTKSIEGLIKNLGVTLYRAYNKVSFRIAGIVILQEKIDIRKSRVTKCKKSNCFERICKSNDKICKILTSRENYDFREIRKLSSQRFANRTDFKRRDFKNINELHPHLPREQFQDSTRKLNGYINDIVEIDINKSWLFDYEKSHTSIEAIRKHLK